MNAKLTRFFVAAMLLAGLVYAQQKVRDGVPEAVSKTTPPERVSALEPGTTTTEDGEQVPTVLDPRVVAVETEYSERMSVLEAQISALSWSEEKKALQRDAEQLKREWHVALTQTQLVIAQEKGDEKAVSDISAHLDKLQNPPARTKKQAIERDPVTGEPLEGVQR